MLLSLSLMLLGGLFAGYCFKKIKFPALFGMIIAGIFLNAYGLIDAETINISSHLRRIALIIILLRAGLSLKANDLKKVGRPAFLMCFVPACFEILGMAILAPIFLHISVKDALVMGSVTAAVSPAVIVPSMLKVMNEKYGTKKGIPQLILAGASVDDVFVIIMFYTFTDIAEGKNFSALSIVLTPVSVIIGILAGIAAGLCLSVFFEKIHSRDTVKIIIILCIGFLLDYAESILPKFIPFSGLIAVMTMGMAIHIKKIEISETLSEGLNKLWTAAEIILFVLVGSAVNPKYAISAGISAALLLVCVLFFRMCGVYLCTINTNLNIKEKLFCMLAYIPKATVQAAIGGIPLAMGLSCGDIVLTVSVLAILITAPLGAFLINLTYKKLLQKELT